MANIEVSGRYSEPVGVSARDEIGDDHRQRTSTPGPSANERPSNIGDDADRISRERAERFELVLSATDQAIWDWDIEKKLLWSSAGYQRLLGLGDKETTEPFDLESQGDRYLDNLHPGDRDAVLRSMRSQLETDTVYDQEYRYRRPSGEYISVHSFGRTFRAPDGRAVRMVGATNDITAKKLAETENRQIREAVDNASEGIVLHDSDHRFVYANKRYREQFPNIGELLVKGARREDIRREYYSRYSVPEAAEHVDDIATEFGESQPPDDNAEFRLSNGTWLKYSDHILPDGTFVGIRTDITDIKRREDELKASEQNLTGITANIADSVVTIDEDGVILSFNKAAEQAFGYRAEEIIGRQIEQLMPEPYATDHAKYVGHYIETGKSAILGKGPREVEAMRKDGSVFPMELAIGEMLVGGRRTFIGAMRDISRRKIVEKALREREQMLRGIFETAAIGITANDQAGRYITYNPAYRDMLGYSDEELQKMTFWDVTHPDDRRPEEPVYADIMAGDIGIYRIDKRYIHKDGSTVWVSLNASNLHDAEGNVIGSIAAVEDITERKLKDEALKKSEKRLAEAQQMASIGNWEFDFATGRLAWSDQVYRLFGLDPRDDAPVIEELLELVHPDDRAVLGHASDRRPVAEGQSQYDYRIVLPNGEVRFIHDRAEEIRDGKDHVIGMRGSSQDITDLKLAEQALRENEANLAEAQRIANMGSWVVTLENKERTHVSWSDQLCRIYGIEPQNVPHMFEDFLALVHEDDREMVKSAWIQALKNNSPNEVEHRIVRPDGEIRYIRTRARIYVDELRGVQRLVGSANDITTRKLADEQLQHVQKMEAVGQLTGGIAHDFNNLLTVIMGNLELLKEDMAEDSDEVGMIDRSIKAVVRGVHLTDRMLAFSRKQTLLPQTTDISALVTGMTDMLRVTLGGGVELRHVDKAETLWPCKIDQSQMENALLNLTINARDAMPEGGTLTVETDNVRLDEKDVAGWTEAAPGDFVMLGVIDTGVGMTEKTLKRVFEPFFTTKEVGKGTGLGLSMAYGFVKQSGGVVTIESQPGKGTAVKLFLPRSES
jgi:PAS domain S-box-containing protein